MTPPPDASSLPRMPLVTPRTQTELREAVGGRRWFHKMEFGELVTAGRHYDANCSWVVRRLQVKRLLLRGATTRERCAVLSSELRKEHVHPALRKHVGRIFIVAWKERLPTLHEYPTVLAELGMAGDEFGPIEWAYGP